MNEAAYEPGEVSYEEVAAARLAIALCHRRGNLLWLGDMVAEAIAAEDRGEPMPNLCD